MPEEEEEQREDGGDEAQAENRTCFVIGPIGEPESDERNWADQVLNYIIKPVLEEMNYSVERADQLPEPGLITSQIIQRVIDATVVVADLTWQNANVFYELAVRHAIRKPFVQLIRRGEQVPFDIAQVRTIEVDIHDLAAAEEAKKELRRQVTAIERGELQPDTPVSVAVDLRTLRLSDDPEQQSLAGLREAVLDMTSRLSSLESWLRRGLPRAPHPIEYYGGPRLHRELELMAEQVELLLDAMDALGAEDVDERTMDGFREEMARLLARLRHVLRRLRG